MFVNCLFVLIAVCLLLLLLFVYIVLKMGDSATARQKPDEFMYTNNKGFYVELYVT